MTALPATPLPGAASRDAADPGNRGRLTISDKAIEKIAAQIALETPGIYGAPGGLLGLGSHHDRDARPKVTVQLAGRIASLQVRAGVRYPAPLRTVTERLRDSLRTQVSERCGIEVRQVDIDITALVTPSEAAGRRELQ